MRNFSGTAAWISSPNRSATREGGANGHASKGSNCYGWWWRPGDCGSVRPTTVARCVPVRSLLSDDEPTRAGNRRAADSAWVGRSGGPSRDGRQRCQPGGLVGRAFRPKICFAALCAAGRSIGGTESETLSTGFVSRSLETQSLLSTSLRHGAGSLAPARRPIPPTPRGPQPPGRRPIPPCPFHRCAPLPYQALDPKPAQSSVGNTAVVLASCFPSLHPTVHQIQVAAARARASSLKIQKSHALHLDVQLHPHGRCRR